MFHIFFSADENYIKFVAPLIFSIIKSTKSNQKFINFAHSQNNDCTEGYVFHILSAKAINSDSIQRLELLCAKLSNIYPCNVVNHAVNDKLFAENNVPIWKGNYQAYLRFFIDNFLDPEVSRCLYLDVDMIVLDDIRRLWTVDITNATLMVAHLPDVFNQNFFNSGFIFFNIKKWRENNYQSKCIDYTIKHRSLDQDTLNAVIKKTQFTHFTKGMELLLANLSKRRRSHSLKVNSRINTIWDKNYSLHPSKTMAPYNQLDRKIERKML